MLLTLVGFSVLPSGTLLKEAKAQTGPTPTVEITSAVDGNGAPISIGGTTSSNSITIGFSVINPGVSLHLICSIDKNPPTTCGGPTTRSITYKDLALGGHFFFLSAFNANGGGSNSPVTFSWTVSQGTGSPPPTFIQGDAATYTAKTKYEPRCFNGPNLGFTTKCCNTVLPA